MTTASRTAYVPDLKAVGKAVDERIRRLQGGYLRDESAAVATLAKIRRGAGKTIEEVPELVGLTIDHDFYETFDIHDPRTPDAETAVHEALTLYALHQQSKSEPMYKRGCEFGAAVRQLMPKDKFDEPVRMRFVQVQKAINKRTRPERLRGIVQLWRNAGIPLDYALLADQLFDAHTPAGAERVRRSWGRGFQAYRPERSTNESPKDTVAVEG